MSGKTVTLGQGTGHSTISAASGASNGSGVVTFTVTDTTVESVTFTATDTTDAVAVTQTAAVTFIPPPSPVLSVSSSDVAASLRDRTAPTR